MNKDTQNLKREIRRLRLLIKAQEREALCVSLGLKPKKIQEIIVKDGHRFYMK